jgi:L-asparaginase / beta-aspartyl-peptidase
MTVPAPWSLVIHGGSGSMTRATLHGAAETACRAGLAAALTAGAAVLATDGSALDAVEAAVRVLEDDPNFNAGRGAVFTAEGGIELDAAIMSSGGAGAVAGVTRTRHPVSLARAVMERSPHVMLARDGADAFALEHDLEQVEPAWFHTPVRWQALEAMKASAAAGGPLFDKALKFGTVGAVARDVRGEMAAATSTGGLTAKRWGRIGDSPLIGAGTWADAAVAMSATGSGEDFIRAAAGHEISARVRHLGEGPRAATDAVLATIHAAGGNGGIIYMGATSAGWAFTTPGMFRGCVTASQKPAVAIFADEG